MGRKDSIQTNKTKSLVSLKEPFANYNYAVWKPDALYLYALILHIKAYFTQNAQVSYFLHFLWFYIFKLFDLNVKNLTF